QHQDPPQRRRLASRPAFPAHRAPALSVQGRGARRRARAGHAPGDGLPAVISRPWAFDPLPGRGHSRAPRDPSQRRLGRRGRDQAQRPVPPGLAIVRRAHALETVGVMGDYRTYANVVAVRVVTSEDAMTADWARVPYEVLARISNRI